MTNIEDAVRDLNNALDQHFSIYSTNQQLHFDWLQSVEFQLKMYGSTRKDSDLDGALTRDGNTSCLVFTSQTDSSAFFEPVPRKRTRSLTVASGRVRFIGERDSGEMLPGSLPCNGWPSSPCLDEPASSPGTRPDFSDPFSIPLQDIPIPTEYPLTDDDDDSPILADEEIYERNPFEIHGKIIPLWARQEQVEETLRKQTVLNPDLIFRASSSCQSTEGIFRQPSLTPTGGNRPLVATRSSPRIPVHISRLEPK
jgi:hypothetical protein